MHSSAGICKDIRLIYEEQFRKPQAHLSPPALGGPGKRGALGALSDQFCPRLALLSPPFMETEAKPQNKHQEENLVCPRIAAHGHKFVPAPLLRCVPHPFRRAPSQNDCYPDPRNPPPLKNFYLSYSGMYIISECPKNKPISGVSVMASYACA